MSLLRVNCPDHQRGLRNPEAGLDLDSYRQATRDPKDYIRNSDGGRIGFFHGYDNEQTATITGNVITEMDLVMGVAFGVSLTIANAYDGYGITTGAWYLEDIETTETKGALAVCTLNALRCPGLLAPT